jgi:hypothetical protein
MGCSPTFSCGLLRPDFSDKGDFTNRLKLRLSATTTNLQGLSIQLHRNIRTFSS